MAALLRLTDVRKTFGGLVAVNALSFEIEAGAIVAMIGPNGAGKSTVFNLITGVYEPTSGAIDLDGRTICGLKTHAIAGLGIARTFQNIRLFAFMSALDNVMTGRHSRMRASLFDSLLHTPAQRGEEKRVRERARELLRFCGLEREADAGLAFEMDRLHRSCRRLIWLNPLLRYGGFEAKAQGIKMMLPHVDEFRPVHNLRSIEGLIAALSAATPPHHRGAIRPAA